MQFPIDLSFDFIRGTHLSGSDFPRWRPNKIQISNRKSLENAEISFSQIISKIILICTWNGELGKVFGVNAFNYDVIDHFWKFKMAEIQYGRQTEIRKNAFG